MSTVSSQLRVKALRPAPLPRPRLTIVPKVAAHASRIPFVLLVVSVLAVGLVGLLLLNTALQRGAYQVTDLRTRAAQLALQEQNLRVQVADLKQPQNLAARALRLGMVQNDSPAFLSLSGGDVIGAAAPGVAGNRVDVGVSLASAVATAGKITPTTAGMQTTGATRPVTSRPDKPASATADDGARTTNFLDTPTGSDPNG